MENDAILDNNNRCICCGDIIPEGRQICPLCEDILANGTIWRADETKDIYHKGHVYFAYSPKGYCAEVGYCTEVDLTLCFGEGNEPKSLADKRLRSCVYQEYKENHKYAEINHNYTEIKEYNDNHNYEEVKEDKSIMKFLAKNLVIFYILSFTWGFITSFIGLLMLIPLAFAKRVHRDHGRLYGVFPEAFGMGWGFGMGCFFFVSDNCEGDLDVYSHEMGHGLQNILFGPLMLFIVIMPSVIRFWYRQFKYYGRGETPKTPYEAVWFERQATDWGNKYLKD